MLHITLKKPLAFGLLALSLGALGQRGQALAQGGTLVVKGVNADLAKLDPAADYWKTAPEEKVTLQGQPMVQPMQPVTTTDALIVKAVHSDTHVAFRLQWKDTEKSEAGKLGEQSDAVAIQFPVKVANEPPPIFMGFKDNPVHIFHWRAQYQRDAEKGKPEMPDLYPNMSVDMYHLDYKFEKELKFDEGKKNIYNPAKALGNPQSFPKGGVDEVLAEGYGTSAVQAPAGSKAKGVWEKGEWTVVLVRPLRNENGNSLKAGDKSFAAFAVWQGGKGEVGSRKSLTMQWLPIVLDDGKVLGGR